MLLLNKKYYILTLYLLIGSDVFSQVKFNNRYDLDKGAEAFGAVIYSNNNFIMLGRSLDSMIYYTAPAPKAKIGLIIIDSVGEVKSINKVGNSYYDYYGGKNIIEKGQMFYYNAPYLDTFNHAHQYLFKFNEQGDSLLLKHYFENDTSFNMIGSSCVTKNNNLFLCGQVDSSTNYSINPNMYLMKTDTLGNIIWWKTYGGSQYEACTNMDTCSDGGFILGGWTTSFGGADQDPYIVKTDSNGNFQWHKTINSNSFEDWPAVVLSTKDGGILAVTTEVQKEDVNFNTWVKIWFNKYDIAGNLLWRKNIGDTIFSTPVFSVKEASNGDIIALGNNQRHDYIIKINQNGDSLLMKQVKWFEGGCKLNSQYGFDLALIDSGGYAIARFIVPSPASINNTQDAWLSTYDSLGCQLPNAPTNLTATVNYVGNDTLIELNWQYNSSNPNELFILEEYLPESFVWDIRNDECLNIFPTVGSIVISNTQYTDTLKNKTKAIYRVSAVDTLTHLTSCYSNISVVDLTTSVDEKTINNNAVKVYPNPNNGTFTLALTHTNQAIVAIFNLSGQLLQQHNVNTTTEIDISNQPNGMYFYQVNMNNTIVTGKIIKN
ncbi:MAG: T9SS type A sorting domain-containing protein [Vicingaceae bacterium]|nr:T9SS type A sorting domain-containing protein [Vicingaceae bacterium]